MWVKRIFDIVFTLLVLIVIGWLILLCIVIAHYSTNAPGIYRQKRIGKGNRPFYLYKIRSMKIVEVHKSNTTVKNDPRVTKFGNFIRKTKIDELPQFINVLLGDMSIVGPRPTVWEDFTKMNEKQKRRFSVKPGLTGLAQVNGNTSLNWPDRIRMDLNYIDNWSISLDIIIILKTVFLIVSNKSETHPATDNEWK